MRRRDGRFTVKPLPAAVAAALAAGYAPTAALAQDGGALEEIVVTASRRATTVQELPFNIAAIGGETLERQRITTLGDLARSVPGLTVVNQGARDAELMTVRGLNVLSLNAAELILSNDSGNTVASYLGEIPLYVDFRMKDLERVEVLLGPQGTLYGAGTLAGAVRYIPNAPDTTATTFTAHGDLYGVAHSDGSGYDADFAVNVPLIENRLAFRAAVSYLDDPGFIDYPYVVREPGVSNPQPNFADPGDVAANLRRVADADWQQTTSGRLALKWEASDTVSATLNYYFQDQEVGARTVNNRHAFGTDRYESAHRFVEPSDRENRLVSLEIVADLGFAELTSATGVSEFDMIGQRDQTDLLLDFEYGYEDFPSFVAYTREIQNEKRVNQELRLVSTGDGPLGWIVGVFHHDAEFDASSEEFTPGFPEFAGFSLPSGDLEYLQITRQKLTEQALFGEISYQFTDRLAMAFGGRWFEFDDDSFIGFEIPFVAISNARGNVADDDGFLGKVNVSYAFSDGVVGYATVSEGYRVGGVNAIAECILPLPPGQNVCALPHEVLFKPDVTTNFELGMHGAWRGGALTLSAALFQVDWEDIQTGGFTENGSVPITVNGNDARSRGVELGVQGRIGSRWTLTGSYAFTNAELASDAPGLVDGADAFAGDRLPGTPEHQGSFYVRHERTLPNGWSLDASYGFAFTSDVITKVGWRNNGERLGGYTVHNASFGVGKDSWSATLYADNLTDKFAETAVRQDPSVIRDVDGIPLRRYFRNVLRPRTIGVEFRYRFGD